MNQEILKSTNTYYTKKIEEFGRTSRGVDWNSTESQRLRFEQITKILSGEVNNSFSICDWRNVGIAVNIMAWIFLKK